MSKAPLRLCRAACALALLLAAPALHAQETPARLCAAPTPTDAEMRQTAAAVQAWLAENPGGAGGDVVRIPVAFHVIRSGTATAQGNVPDQWVTDQIDVLTDAFLPLGYEFVLAKVDRTTNPTWYNGLTVGANETQMKLALATEPARFLNIYTAALGGGLLGWAYFPNSFPEFYFMHGTVLHSQSLPGGSLFPYNQGDTGTHEVGHYAGLYHTFERGCADGDVAPACQTGGDQACDTPAEASPAFGCPAGRNTCATGGPDPIQNFMDYSDDACMFEFTPDQATRALSLMTTYRPTIMSNPGAFASPGEIEFEDVPVGESLTETVLVVNLTDAPLVITSVTSSNPRFTVSTTSLNVPALSGDSTLSVTFTPNDEEPLTATLTLVTTNPDVGTLTVDLSGNGFIAAPAGAIEIPALLAAAGTGGTDTETVTLSNVGTAPLEYSFANVPTWITDITPAPGEVAPGDEQEVTFTFDAAGLSTGVYQNIVRLLTNDPILEQVGVHAVFAVGGVMPPPALVTPLYGAPEVPTDYTLGWLDVPDAVAYDVQVATDDDFSNVVASATVTDNEAAFAAEAGVTLYWRVRSVDAGSNTSEWSLAYVFTVTNIVANEPDPTAPERATLGAAYPNPAREGLTVPFTLADPRPVTLRVYDVTGRLVAALAEGQPFAAGLHELYWEAGDLPAGVYLVRFVAGDESATSRVALVR